MHSNEQVSSCRVNSRIEVTTLCELSCSCSGFIYYRVLTVYNEGVCYTCNILYSSYDR